MPLTQKETKELARLLGKMEWPLPKEVFHALLLKVVSVPQEVAVLDNTNRIVTVYRSDAEFDGHHMPGTVLRNNESVMQSLWRLLRDELAGNRIASITNIGWMEIQQGHSPGRNPTRHEVSLLWIARLANPYRGEGKLSRLDRLPKNTLSHHRLLVRKVRKYLRTGRPILGR